MGSELKQKLKDGDIFSWRWRDEKKHADCGLYRSYHCKSRIATVTGDFLHDTYWHGASCDSGINEDDVVLTWLGNKHDMREIGPDNTAYYNSDDIVDMSHPNNTRGKVYLKPGATKSRYVMRKEAEHRREDAEREICFAQREIERMKQLRAMIDNGDLDVVYF